ncbi:hypothetical protein F511_12499 [Dorcoceras hygrometricum]|uniref:Uncharacterized protein n=1 Tax=Dorcoceras hygrometricum TaxID=472368 RepID=A0A2Z7AUU1_9LAMI|nr:hypothetical protein F511_12499 [Dorcoceras hygrometricum]
MGCPGQARTKPRRKLSIASLPEIRRTAAAGNASAARLRNLCGNAAPFAAHSSATAAPSIVQPVHGAAACGRPIVAQPCAKQRPTLARQARQARCYRERMCARGKGGGRGRFLNCYQSPFNGCHIRNPTIGLILSNPRLLIAKINRGDQQKSISRCLLFLSLKSAEEIKCCIRNYIPTKRNDAAAFYQQATISLAKNQMLVVEFPSKPISSWLRKFTQNDDASTNLDDSVLYMPHRYQLLVNQQASILHNDSKPAVALNQTTSLRL